MEFRWTHPENAAGERLYRFVVRDEKLSVKYSVGTNDESLQRRPTHGLQGKFDWYVETESCMGFDKAIIKLATKSNARPFHLIRSLDAKADLAKLLLRSNS
jgi:hypothetical protein